MKENKLIELSMDFSVDIINLVKHLKSSHESVISKLEIALKEASETGYWLELLYRTKYIDEPFFKSLSSKCSSLRVMLISSCKTAKQNLDK